MENDIDLVIINGCFNCGGNISSYRLIRGLPCEDDIKEDQIKNISINEESLYKLLKENNRLKNYEEIYNLYKESQEFYNFFKEKMNSEPWSIQISWFKRLIKNQSFSIIAPTGIGKSTFIILASIYMARKYNKKSLIILPTRILVKQFRERAESFDNNIKILTPKSKKEEIKDYDILVITNNFLSKNFDLIKDKHFDYIFIDDVDAFFKGSKNIEKVLNILGFSEDDLKFLKKFIDDIIRGNINEKNIEEYNKKLEEIKKKRRGSLILSSASGTSKGKRTLYYKYLLDFTIGTTSTKLRNVIDTYILVNDEKEKIDKLLKLIEILKDGIIIYIPKHLSKEYLDNIYNLLISKGYKIGKVLSKEKESLENIERFAKGEINILIGIADQYSILTRGIDLPTRIKYAIFLDVPYIELNLSKIDENINLNNLLILFNIFKNFVKEDVKRMFNNKLRYVKKLLKYQSAESLLLLNNAIKENKPLEGNLEYIRKTLLELYGYVKDIMNNKNIIKEASEKSNIILENKNNELYIKILDFKTYIQASGRTSRLYAGGISKGLSIIISSNKKLLEVLDNRLNWYLY